ncbi:hypothetical protein IMZ48_16020 [Candidatus Bathyarchaeota archaeon]|nr:hypothetical protein [Candidatus Bathyarchaeota archaeon]
MGSPLLEATLRDLRGAVIQVAAALEEEGAALRHLFGYVVVAVCCHKGREQRG